MSLIRLSTRILRTRAIARHTPIASTLLFRRFSVIPEKKETVVSVPVVEEKAPITEVEEKNEEAVDAPKKTIKERIISLYKENEIYIRRTGIMSIVAANSYIVYSSSMYLMNTMQEIGSKYLLETCYAAGIVSATAAGAMISTASKMMKLDADDIYKKVLEQTLKDSRVIEELGDNIKASTFSAFSHVDGGFRLRGEPNVDYHGWTRVWRPAQLQLLFRLDGDKASAMMGCEVETDGKSGYIYNVLTLNNLKTHSKTVLFGDENKSVWRGLTALR